MNLDDLDKPVEHHECPYIISIHICKGILKRLFVTPTRVLPIVGLQLLLKYHLLVLFRAQCHQINVYNLQSTGKNSFEKNSLPKFFFVNPQSSKYYIY